MSRSSGHQTDLGARRRGAEPGRRSLHDRAGIALAVLAAALAAVLLTVAPAKAEQSVEGSNAVPPLVIDTGLELGHDHAQTHNGGAVPLFELLGIKWKSRKILYNNTANSYRREVKQAAAAWNRSGTKARWVATSKGRADVIVRIDKHLFTAGLATHNGRKGTIDLQPGLTKLGGNKAVGRASARGVIAHEMGHIMGLDHPSTSCATMNASLWGNCKQPKKSWLYRCRTLYSDDIRGGVHLFGGKPRKPASEFCPLEKAPAAVSSLTGTYREGEGVRLWWKLPRKRKPHSVSMYRGKRDDKCPRTSGKGGHQVYGSKTSAFDSITKAGTYCYVAVTAGKFGRPGKGAQTRVKVTGISPSAEFGYYQSDATTVEFEDYSYDDGRITKWSWDFGDGGPASSEQNPTHVFAAPGEYQVTLTVTDDSGLTASTTDTVYVDDWSSWE